MQHTRAVLFLVLAVAYVSVVAILQPGGSTRADQSTGFAHLHIDANPTNGTGPCSIIDTARTVAPGDAVTVALCMDESELSPVNGGLTALTLEVPYTAPLTATDGVANNTTDLNGNPDWNEAGLGGAWDCNQLNSLDSGPNATPSPATITCGTTSLTDQPVTGTILLATLTFDNASTVGTSTLSWGPGTSILAGVSELVCGGSIGCSEATVIVSLPATPTSTPTHTATATATHTPTSSHTATSTPTATSTSSPTPSPTRVPGSCDGDVNLDTFVDGRDLALVAQRLHASVPDQRYDVQEDINGDGTINALDLRLVLQDMRTGVCS